MPEPNPKVPENTVGYIEDQIGADVPRDLIKVALAAQDLGQLDVSAAEVDVNVTDQTLNNLAANVEQIGGQAQSAVDVATKIDQLQSALASVAGDTLQVSTPTPIDASGATIAVQEDTPLDASGATVLVQEDTPLDASGATVPIQESTPLDVTGATVSVQEDTALNVSGATVAVQEDTPLDASGSPIGLADSTGTRIDPLTQAVLSSVATDELRVDLQADGVGLLQTADQPLDVSGATVTVTDDGSLAIDAATTDTLSTEQQSPVAVEDTAGAQVDPALGADYLDAQTTGYDLVASGDLTIGPGPVERGTGVIIAARSTDTNAFSVSVEWQDSAGNVFQSESATDIGLNGITGDYARLVRKGPQVQVTATDDSGAAQNLINIHADTER